MRDLSYVWMCARSNWGKLRSNPIPLTLLCVQTVYALWNLGWMVEFCFRTGTRVSPWIFPFTFLSDVMAIYYGASLLLLFASAPFEDAHTPFLMIRTGKANWICGQVLYIWGCGVLLPLSIYVSELLILLPRMGISSGWGGVLKSLAADSDLPARYGISPSGIFIVDAVIKQYSPIEATMVTLLLAIAAAVFFGTLILLLNVAYKPGSGVVAAGILVFWSALSTYVGQFLYGKWIGYTRPLSWISLFCLSPHAAYAPSVSAAIAALIGLSLIFSALSVFLYCHRDAQHKT